jgi:hypothetical protein
MRSRCWRNIASMARSAAVSIGVTGAASQPPPTVRPGRAASRTTQAHPCLPQPPIANHGAPSMVAGEPGRHIDVAVVADREPRRAIDGRRRTRAAHRRRGRGRSRTTARHRWSPANQGGTSTSQRARAVRERRLAGRRLGSRRRAGAWWWSRAQWQWVGRAGRMAGRIVLGIGGKDVDDCAGRLRAFACGRPARPPTLRRWRLQP